VELEWAALGFAASARLRARLQRMSAAGLAALRERTVETLAEMRGAHVRHTPLFASFPDGIPDYTLKLWWQKVLSHFLQAENQPCLFCRLRGTTHVLRPCLHVVCDRCFDGASYTACPVCEHHVDRSSPFFVEPPERELSAKERITFRLLDLGDDAAVAARAL